MCVCVCACVCMCVCVCMHMWVTVCNQVHLHTVFVLYSVCRSVSVFFLFFCVNVIQFFMYVLHVIIWKSRRQCKRK